MVLSAAQQKLVVSTTVLLAILSPVNFQLHFTSKWLPRVILFERVYKTHININ